MTRDRLTNLTARFLIGSVSALALSYLGRQEPPRPPWSLRAGENFAEQAPESILALRYAVGAMIVDAHRESGSTGFAVEVHLSGNHRTTRCSAGPALGGVVADLKTITVVQPLEWVDARRLYTVDLGTLTIGAEGTDPSVTVRMATDRARHSLVVFADEGAFATNLPIDLIDRFRTMCEDKG